jgi:hypothetical protein
MSSAVGAGRVRGGVESVDLVPTVWLRRIQERSSREEGERLTTAVLADEVPDTPVEGLIGVVVAGRGTGVLALYTVSECPLEAPRWREHGGRVDEGRVGGVSWWGGWVHCVSQSSRSEEAMEGGGVETAPDGEALRDQVSGRLGVHWESTTLGGVCRELQEKRPEQQIEDAGLVE